VTISDRLRSFGSLKCAKEARPLEAGSFIHGEQLKEADDHQKNARNTGCYGNSSTLSR